MFSRINAPPWKSVVEPTRALEKEALKNPPKSRSSPPDDFLLLTCEHGGNRIPREYSSLFRGSEDVLASHRGWDPGALTLARFMAKQLRRPLISNTWCRLLVEPNRTPSNPRIWSQFTTALPKTEREQILERWWHPHRDAVTNAVAAAAREQRVVHVAIHSFTPELNGELRNTEIGLLYDPKRKSEAALCRRWAEKLRSKDLNLRVRMNYPYRGNADGLTTWLRRRHPVSRYLGIELEINQALVNAPGWMEFQRAITTCLRDLISPR